MITISRDVHTSSIINQVDNLLEAALVCKASDIHLESCADGLRIRFRIDGMLYDQESIPADHSLQVISRIKVLASVDISQKRVPQDGKFSISYQGYPIDLRVSTFPSLHGQKIVIRILHRQHQHLSCKQLGFNDEMYIQFMDYIQKATGFCLVTGPTGSGKTTTLYAALSHLNDPAKNIVTLEDPIEYNLDGITQGQIHPEAGFTFEVGMRSLLRQDPDIIMIGEVRDKQTARTALEASLTGHLVFSTVHTNDAPSTIMRLMDMEIEPYLLNASLTAVISQRLARTICSACKVERLPNQAESAFLDRFDAQGITLFEGTGCAGCYQTGYKGRIGIFELLPVTNALRALMVAHPNIEQVYAQAADDGYMPLVHDGLAKVHEGFISLSELMRVIF